jgi:hypothetical protein
MRRPTLLWAGPLSMSILVMACAGTVPPPPPESESETTTESTRPTEPTDTAKKQVVPPAAPVVQPVLVPDSTGPEPRPFVVVEKQNLKAVRTRLIPRVMGRGWTLSVNKSDSIEFLRNADPAMTAFLFKSPPVPAARIRLRFRLKEDKQNVTIVSTAHLVGNAVYPYRPVLKVLEENLAELRTDLLTAPSSMAPLIDRVPPKRK